jgi:hypothetical protein
MSGYKNDTNPSKLGGGVPGGFEAGFQHTQVGSEVAMKRKILRKAFKTNKVTNGTKTIPSRSGPFRTAFNLGDPLSRRNWGLTSTDLARTVTVDGEEFTTTDVPLASGNSKHISDSSLYTKFKHLRAVNLTYNDKSGGGDDHNGSYSFLNNLRG